MLHGISYVNLLLYSATIPDYGGKDKKGKGGSVGKKPAGPVIKADDPKNKDLVKAIIGGYLF